MEYSTLSEICRKCAECCKHYACVELSQNEINALEIFTGLHFELFTYSKGKADEGYFLKFEENGDCVFLNKNNNGHSCRVYEARPEICKNYPSNPSQNKACKANIKNMPKS
ncbi:MAG: YkgJ family cysteine cluster protein [Chlamydiota bacterium]|nr:YkgJ family cysteine cluster protein [Chlamydiota bacterium]